MTEKQYRNQFGVRDDLATPGELAARDKGLYDPRGASGDRGNVLVKLWCVKCGSQLGELVSFEKRDLFHSRRENTWTRGPSDMKCRACFLPLEGFPVDMDAINAAAETARHAGRTKHVKIGSKPANLQ